MTQQYVAHGGEPQDPETLRAQLKQALAENEQLRKGPTEETPWFLNPFRMDARYADNDPRNTPGTAEFNAAREEKMRLQVRSQNQRLAAAAAEMDKVVGKDQYGNPITGFAADAIKAANLMVEDMFPNVEPVFREGTDIEILDPDQPLDAPINDPEDAIHRRELERRHQGRWMRQVEEDRKAGRPFKPYTPPGHVPSEREQQVDLVRKTIHESVHKMMGTTSEAVAERQARQQQVLDLMAKGDFESRIAAAELINGNADV